MSEKTSTLFFTYKPRTKKQTISSNKSFKEPIRTLHCEKDGYQWYELRLGALIGAENTKGKTLIPISRGYEYCIVYQHNDYIGDYFEVNTYKGGKGTCDLDGNEIIAPNRGYNSIYFLFNEKESVDWYDIRKHKPFGFKHGARDINGIEIIPPKHGQQLNYSAGLGFYYLKNRLSHIRGDKTTLGIKL